MVFWFYWRKSMSISQKDKDEMVAERARWFSFIDQAENCHVQKPGEQLVFEITVAEVLGIGQWSMALSEEAIVKDTEGKIWLIPETCEDDGNLHGLISRWNVQPGMKLRLRIKAITHFETSAFPITPE